MNFLLKISRPRFWIYLMGPFLIGCMAALQSLPSQSQLLTILIGLIFFSFPANLYIYAINDMYDYETDRINPKKHGYETAVNLKGNTALNIVLSYILVLSLGAALLFFESKTQLAFLCFFLLGHFYSAPPVRAKAKPLLDTLFNALYIMPGLFGFYLLGGGELQTQWNFVFAAIFWAMAMHVYSALPDIESDKKASIQTTATILGKNGTLILCAVLFCSSAYLVFNFLGLITILTLLPYLVLLTLTWIRSDNTLALYSAFPIVNTLVGLILFICIITKLI